ncbi:MAG: SCO6880 family protein [Sporichthyaceae bacterium]
MSATTAAAAGERPARPTYGNWVTHKSPGLFGAGLLGSAVFFLAAVAALVALMVAGLAAAGVVAVLGAVAFTLTGTSTGPALTRRAANLRQRQLRENQHRSGVFSRNSDPAMRLPGMLGRTTLLSKTDPFGVDFAVIKSPRGLYTIVARALAEGPSLQDQDQINAWVAGFARVLSSAGQEPGLVCAKAITDTAPDPGGRLAQMVHAARDPRGPELARSVMEECLAAYPAASSENITYLELTFHGKRLSRKGDEAAICSELARKVPGLLGALKEAGGGAVDMVTAAELPAIVRVAYDPAAQPHLERAELTGLDEPITWEQAGPVAAQESWGSYRHDSGTSITWEMHGAPRAAINETSLAALLSPHRDFTRKRVALIFRPQSPERSAKVAETDAQTATFTADQNAGRQVSAAASLRCRATEQSRQEVASGAVMVKFSLLVTATVTDPENLDQAIATVEARAGAVPIRLRPCAGSQAAAFATTLPVGVVPWEHTVIPAKVREVL